jgi:hypothetical protein
MTPSGMRFISMRPLRISSNAVVGVTWPSAREGAVLPIDGAMVDVPFAKCDAATLVGTAGR